MEDDYRDEDRIIEENEGDFLTVVQEYCQKNILRQVARGFLFGLGHYITYKLVGGYMSRRFPQFN